ncbi:hypothetical protein CLV84_0501 [Neolewinella xylanilytica]|uniref:Uncharacterized protein n=2 Tax=Neolewinella xylanilytica TaxID=1514080 RepID=A0A2S6I7W8_9BACT|nr:hypothetical protein CLV84_0501 [Neolewinella xylanilytica]
MIRESKIKTLGELQRRKKQVRMETELAKREFAHSIGTTRGNATNFLVKKVAAPAGGAVVGLMLLNSILSSSNKKQQVIKETKVIHEYPDGTPYKEGRSRSKRSRLKTFTGLVGSLRVVIPVLQAVIGAFQTHKAKEAAQRANASARRS